VREKIRVKSFTVIGGTGEKEKLTENVGNRSVEVG